MKMKMKEKIKRTQMIKRRSDWGGGRCEGKKKEKGDEEEDGGEDKENTKAKEEESIEGEGQKERR